MTQRAAGKVPLPEEWAGEPPPKPLDVEVAVSDGEIYTKLIWNQRWLDGLEAFIRSVVRDEQGD